MPVPTPILRSRTCNLTLAGLLVLIILGRAGAGRAEEPAAVLDLNQLLKECTAKGEKTLRLPAGAHHASGALELKDLDGLTLDGQGATLYFKPRTPAITIRNCRNLTVRNLVIDYDPLCFSQGTITAADFATNTLDITLHAGYPAPRADQRTAIHVFDPQTRLWKTGAPDLGAKEVKEIAPGVVRAATGFKDLGKYVAVGDLVAMDNRTASPAAFSVRGITENLLVEDVTFYGAPSLAIVARFCQGQHVYRRIKIGRGPKPAGATEDRLFSSDADGFNYAYCVPGPVVEECDFAFMGDDSINLHGATFPIGRVESDTSLLLLRPNGREGFDEVIKPGAAVRLLAKGNFAILAQSVAKSIEYLPDHAGFTYDEVVKYFGPHKQHNPSASYSIYRLTLEQPLPAQPEQYVDVPSINCPNFQIRNNYFHDHRARGLRIMAPHGLIENNRFERISQNAISLGAEYAFWRESGWVEDITIRNNRIDDVCRGWLVTSPYGYVPGAIGVFARSEDPTLPYFPGNRNLRIENNQITGSRVAGIYAYAADGVTVTGNRLRQVCTGELGDAGTSFSLSVKDPIEFHSSVKNAKAENNQVD